MVWEQSVSSSFARALSDLGSSAARDSGAWPVQALKKDGQKFATRARGVVVELEHATGGVGLCT